MCACLRARACVCVCVCACLPVCVCVCVYVREREREVQKLSACHSFTPSSGELRSTTPVHNSTCQRSTSSAQLSQHLTPLFNHNDLPQAKHGRYFLCENQPQLKLLLLIKFQMHCRLLAVFCSPFLGLVLGREAGSWAGSRRSVDYQS